MESVMMESVMMESVLIESVTLDVPPADQEADQEADREAAAALPEGRYDEGSDDEGGGFVAGDSAVPGEGSAAAAVDDDPVGLL